MQDKNGLSYRLRLMDLLEPWHTPLQWIHDIAYENLRDIDLRTVLLCLRDMRYHPPRGGDTTFDSLNEWCATAVAKHFAIHNLLSLIGLKPQLWMARYCMAENLPITCPVLGKAARRLKVQDVHVYLECDFGAGERILDFTYPRHMASFGFPVTQQWSMEEDCVLPFALKESRSITPNAQGLVQIDIWRKQLNQGMAMHYNTLIREHIIECGSRDDADENTRDYIRRHYLRLPLAHPGH